MEGYGNIPGKKQISLRERERVIMDIKSNVRFEATFGTRNDRIWVHIGQRKAELPVYPKFWA